MIVLHLRDNQCQYLEFEPKITVNKGNKNEILIF